ncbi:unnamed protein product, partial [Didymodactylos carnosus]
VKYAVVYGVRQRRPYTHRFYESRREIRQVKHEQSLASAAALDNALDNLDEEDDDDQSSTHRTSVTNFNAQLSDTINKNTEAQILSQLDELRLKFDQGDISFGEYLSELKKIVDAQKIH